jgi:signal peptide peptidase SppA
MSVEGLLYRPLALLPAHARALLDRFRLLDGAEPPKALMERDEGRDRRPFLVVDGVAVIPIQGVLVHGNAYSWWGQTSYGTIRACLDLAVADAEVRAILLHVDSPGGEVAGCFDLADHIYALRAVKPVAAIVDECACSAAYALACAAEKILAPRSAVIGSIGVITMHLDVTAALEQAGLKVTTIQFGGRKSDSYSTTPLSDDARDRMQADVDRLGEMFVALVARNRGLDADKVRATEAGVFLGQAAVEQGLADAVMPTDAAFAAVLDALTE